MNVRNKRNQLHTTKEAERDFRNTGKVLTIVSVNPSRVTVYFLEEV